MQNLLAATLSQSSSDKLGEYLGGCPFDHHEPEKWFVPIFSSKQDLDSSIVAPKVRYEAIPIRVDYWYDDGLSMTNLVIILKCDLMEQRHQMVEALGYTPEVLIEHYTPHLTLVFGIPPLSSSIKSFVNSLNNHYNPHTGTRIILDSEILLDSGGYVPNATGQKWHQDHTF